ncbi:hypothetical protein EGY05_11065 [Chryseobacterium arthrosphaerae]|nr:hypothetical protein EGY05_11065 [Chryseobacterium arthrosphaerae]
MKNKCRFMIGTSVTLAPARRSHQLAGMLGVELGIAAAPKTIFKLATDNHAFYNIYQDSNKELLITKKNNEIQNYKFYFSYVFIFL